MTEKLEYSAADMASAAAGGWRDGQRAAAEVAQSAAAGEREAWTARKPTEPGAYWVRGNGLEADALVQVKLDDGELWCNLHMRTTEPDFGYGYSIEQLSDDFEWLGPLHVAAWQRTQAAGVPEGWRIAPTGDGDGVVVSSPRINGIASHTAVFPDDNDPAHKLLWAMLAAAPAQPAAQAEENYSTTSDRYRADLYDEVWQRARDMGYGNVTMALEDLAAFRANAPAQSDVQRLREALRITRDTIDRQLEVIASRAPGNYLDKLPVVSSLKAHRARCDAALAASTGQEVES